MTPPVTSADTVQATLDASHVGLMTFGRVMASSVGIALSSAVVLSGAGTSAVPLDMNQARAVGRPSSGIGVPHIVVVSPMTVPSDDPRADPVSVPRSVPDEWVKELRSIRNIDRPDDFDGYYSQE